MTGLHILRFWRVTCMSWTQSAASLCRDNKIDILVFNLNDPDNIVRALSGEKIGTIVRIIQCTEVIL